MTWFTYIFPIPTFSIFEWGLTKCFHCNYQALHLPSIRRKVPRLFLWDLRRRCWRCIITIGRCGDRKRCLRVRRRWVQLSPACKYKTLIFIFKCIVQGRLMLGVALLNPQVCWNKDLVGYLPGMPSLHDFLLHAKKPRLHQNGVTFSVPIFELNECCHQLVSQANDGGLFLFHCVMVARLLFLLFDSPERDAL